LPFALAAIVALLALPLAARATDAPSETPVAQEITLTSGDTPLSGYLYRPEEPGRHPAVLCLHAFGSDAESLRGTAATLAQFGYVAAAIDLRGAGRSAGKPEFAAGEVQDALATLTYLRQQEWVDPERVALWGAGTGGTVDLLAAAADPRLKAAAALLAPTDTAAFTTALAQQAPPLAEAITNAVGATPAQDSDAYRRRSPIHAAARIRAAVLAIYAAQDALVPPTHGRNLRLAMQKAGRSCTVQVHPGNGPAALAGASLAMIRVLNETLRNTPATGSRRSCLLRCMDLLEQLRVRQIAGSPVSADLFTECDIALAAFQAGKYRLADQLLTEALAALARSR